jgi:hypothetical protein
LKIREKEKGLIVTCKLEVPKKDLATGLPMIIYLVASLAYMKRGIDYPPTPMDPNA